eukprot:GAHX01003187.1.p1 GENE.GAHX01003187.1~~GAHX01003187.1.p1  ORF type:complete len:249 (-),score=76.78 GAHX01003187.1:195-941(-)
MDKSSQNKKKLNMCLTLKDINHLNDCIDKCSKEIEVSGLEDTVKERLVKMYKKNLFKLIFSKVDIITKRGLKKYLASVYMSVRNEKEHKNNIRKANEELKELLIEFQASLKQSSTYKRDIEEKMEEQEKAIASDVVNNYNAQIYGEQQAKDEPNETYKDERVVRLFKDCNDKLNLLVEMKNNILGLIRDKGTNKSVILKFINKKTDGLEVDTDSKDEEEENGEESPEDNLEETFIRLESVIKDIRNIQ